MVPSCMDLVICLLEADDYWQVVIRNPSKALALWRRMMRILIREGVKPRVSGFFLFSIVQSMLLFGAETWMVTPYGTVPVGFP